MADISFNIACKELKIAQIAQLNQLFQLLRLVRMLMRKNVNNDVSKDSPISEEFYNVISYQILKPCVCLNFRVIKTALALT